MFRTRSLLFFLSVLLLSAAVFGQPNKPKAKVVLYKDRIAAQWDTVDCVKNVLKANPLLFLRGEIPLYYERALSSRVSGELGVGVTYRDYLNLSITGENDDADDFGGGTEIIPAPSFHVGVRYYMADHLEPEGSYLHLEFAYLRYGKDITEKDSTGAFTSETNRDERIYNDLRLLYGYQKLSGTSNWLFDLYTGLGLRSRAMSIVHEELNIAEDKWTYTVEQKNDVVPVFYLGVKVGLGW